MRRLHEQLAGRLLHQLADRLLTHPLWFVFPQATAEDDHQRANIRPV